MSRRRLLTAVAAAIFVALPAAASAATQPLMGIVPDVPSRHASATEVVRAQAAAARAEAASRRTLTAAAPPLAHVADALPYNNGPVVHSNRTHLIFWQPSGSNLAFEPGYVALMETFLANVAADSHLQTNVYSVSGQYGDSAGPAAYDSTYGGATIVTDPLPANGCTMPLPPPVDTGPTLPSGAGWTVCLTDAQLQTELEHVVSVNNLPQTLKDMYFLVTPDGFGSCTNGGPDQCAASGQGNTGSYTSYCGYHSVTGAFGLLYAVIPYDAAPGHCQSDNPRPNNNPVDPALSTVSHEQNETTTDPTGSGWIDSQQNEIADLCFIDYGPPLGGGATDAWNEQIATGHYWLQELWSDADGTTEKTACIPHADFDTVAMSVPHRAQGDRTITFTGAASQPHGSITSYLWSFGDGKNGSRHKTTHVYMHAGTFKIVLAAIDAWDNIAFAGGQVTVIKPPRPVAKVTGGPPQAAHNPRPRFRFTSTAAVATFQCRVDGAAFHTCKSPWTASRQASGRHRMFLRATDTFAQRSAAASFVFSIG